MADNLDAILSQLICLNPMGAVLTAEEEAFIARHQVSSFVLFARNLPDYASAQALIARLHALAEQPLIAADQEGGRVTRLPQPASHFPSAMAVGAARSPELAYRAGQATARELQAMKLNTSLAPVMDVNNNRANPVIGTRSFGESPRLVAEMGAEWLRGAQAEGIAACAKHFPGHGDTQVDSHAGLPRIDKTRDELERMELAPFRAAIAAGVEMVMPGHLLMTALDGERPASLSRKVVSGFLRVEMGFDGVVITDALDMDAVALDYGIPRAAAEAVRAGCDLVVPIVQHEETLQAIRRAVDAGEIAMGQIEATVERLRRLRDRLARTAEVSAAWLGASEHKSLAGEIAERAVRVRDAGGMLPLQHREGYALIEFALGKATIAEGTMQQTGKLSARLREKVPSLHGLSLPFDPDEAAQLEVRALASQATGLIAVMRQAMHFPAQAEIVRQCLGMGKPTVLIAMRDPYDLDLFPHAPCVIAGFDDSPAMLKEVMKRLVGH
jgi:beta-N-acetylhexosaminidase